MGGGHPRRAFGGPELPAPVPHHAGQADALELVAKTLESKKQPGLYFCGEVLDMDADTGGYNLQLAFSTGYLAGQSAAKALTDK